VPLYSVVIFGLKNILLFGARKHLVHFSQVSNNAPSCQANIFYGIRSHVFFFLYKRKKIKTVDRGDFTTPML